VAIASGDDQRLLLARYQAGESSQRLADKLGVSDSTVLHRLKLAGAERRHHGSHFTAEDRARTVELYAGWGDSSRGRGCDRGCETDRVEMGSTRRGRGARSDPAEWAARRSSGG
jgi:hypothetical protein